MGWILAVVFFVLWRVAVAQMAKVEEVCGYWKNAYEHERKLREGKI